MGEVVVLDGGERIWHLKLAGLSFHEISKELDLPTAYCVSKFRDFQKYLAQDISLEKREQMAHLEMARIDAIQYPQYMAALGGDLKAAEFVLKAITLRARLAQLDSINPNAGDNRSQILIAGGTKEDFIAALIQGRAVASATDDDEEDEEDRE